MAEAHDPDLIDMDVLARVAPVIRIAAHPIRLRIIDFLRAQGEPCPVNQIAAATDASQPTVSQQLRLLKDQGILSCRRSGNNMLYAIANPNVLLILECIRRHESGGCVEL